MKQLFFLILSLSIFLHAEATIWRVNNNAGISSVNTTAQAAHNAATSGDTIHLETSTTSYGAVTATKQLVWIGNGFFVDATKASSLDGIIFNTGSANSILIGLNFLGSISVSTNNITINRCSCPSISLNAISTNLSRDFTLTQSFISGSVTSSFSNPSYNYTLTNNIIVGSLNMTNAFTNIVVVNNSIYSYSNSIAAVVNNNIIYNCSGIIATYASNVYNNLFLGTTNNNYVGNNGNIFVSGNINSTNAVFTSAVSSYNDSWAVLKVGSPAIGNGLGGTNMGAYGGSAPYKPSGIPGVPTFSQFQIQTTPLNTLPVIISTRSNN